MSRLPLFAATATIAVASAAQAQVLSVALKPMAAAPLEQQATSVLKGGAICIKQGSLTASAMRRAFTTGDSDTLLREELTKAGVVVNTSGLASVEVAGVARVSMIDACLPSFGFGNTDTISGKVEVAVEWALTDRATGTEIGRLSTREALERKGASGGLASMVAEAFAANVRALVVNPALRAAAARPLLASAKPDAVQPRDPVVRVLAPWRKTTAKAPHVITAPQIVESDLDMLDNGDSLNQTEFLAVPLEAGETLRLELLEASKGIILLVANPSNRYVAATSQKNPERELSVPIKTAGTYVISVWSKGDPPGASYRLKIDTDRRPYVTWEPPRPSPPPAKFMAAEAPATKPGELATKPKPKPQVARPAAPPALPKFTPPPGVLAAEVGKSIARPAGKVGASVDLFAFIGESGSALQASAGAPGGGGHAITLYTPEGNEMLKADGVDLTKLSAVLPKDGIYLLAVGRQNAAKPYKLTLAAESPDLFQWSFRNAAGYNVYDAKGALSFSTCWTAPGQTLQYKFANGVTGDLTVQRGGAGRWESPGQPARAFTTQLAAGVFVRTYENSDFTPDSWALDAPDPDTGAYRGYLCR
jgi:hypothetical protein